MIKTVAPKKSFLEDFEDVAPTTVASTEGKLSDFEDVSGPIVVKQAEGSPTNQDKLTAIKQTLNSMPGMFFSPAQAARFTEKASLGYLKPKVEEPQGWGQQAALGGYSLAGEMAPYLGTSMAIEAGSAIPSIAKFLGGPIGGEVPLAAPKILQVLGKMGKGAGTFGAVGASRPAKDLKERLETAKKEAALGALGEGLFNVGGIALEKLKVPTLMAAAQIAGRSTEAIKWAEKRGFKSILSPLASARNAYTNIRDNVLSDLNNYLEGKGVSADQVRQKTYLMGQALKEGVGESLDNFGRKIEHEVATAPGLAAARVKIAPAVDLINSELAKADRYAYAGKSLLSDADKATLTFIRDAIQKGPGTFGNLMRFDKAHDIKSKVIYNLAKYEGKTDQADRILQRVGGILNEQLRENPLYKKANDRYRLLMGVKENLGSFLKLEKEGQGIEKPLLNLWKQNLGTLKDVKRLNALLPADKKFVKELKTILGDPDYQLGDALTKLLTDDQGVEKLASIGKATLDVGASGKDPAMQKIEAFGGKIGKDYLSKLKDAAAYIAIMEDKSRGPGIFVYNKILQSLLKGLDMEKQSAKGLFNRPGMGTVGPYLLYKETMDNK